jgi:hypothetical protein
MKNNAESLLPTILKNLEWVEYLYYLADFLITIPSKELKSAATVATPKFEKNILIWFYPTSDCFTHCLINKIMKKHRTITTKVPKIIKAFLLCYFCIGIFFQIISVESTIY